MIDEPASVRRLVFGPDGITLAAAYENGSIILWDMLAGEKKRQRELTNSKHIDLIHWEEDSLLIAGYYSGFNRWNLDNDKVTNLLPFTGGSITTVSSDGKCVATPQLQDGWMFRLTGEEPILVVQDLQTFEVLDYLKCEDISTDAIMINVFEMIYNPARYEIAALLEANLGVYGWDYRFYLWDVNSEITRIWDGVFYCKPSALTFSPKGNHIAFFNRDDNSIYITSTGDNFKSRDLYDIGDDIQSISFSPDEKLIAIGGQDPNIRIFEIDTGKFHYEIEVEAPITSITFDPTGEFLVAGTEDGTILLWQLTASRF